MIKKCLVYELNCNIYFDPFLCITKTGFNKVKNIHYKMLLEYK